MLHNYFCFKITIPSKFGQYTVWIAAPFMPAPSPWSAILATATLMQKVVLTVQTGPRGEAESEQVFVPSWWFRWKRRKSCSTGFCLILIHCGSSPLVHLLTQSSHWVTATAHYCFFCLNWQNYVISEISLRQCSRWQQKRRGLLLTFILQSKVRQRKF